VRKEERHLLKKYGIRFGSFEERRNKQQGMRRKRKGKRRIKLRGGFKKKFRV